MKSNLFVSILHELHVPFTKGYACHVYEEHPYKYTFFGLKSLCERYGIEAEGMLLYEKKTILTLSAPFVAKFNEDYALVKKVDETEVVFEMYGTNNHLLPSDFLTNCSGHVLVFSSNENSIEPNYKKHLFNQRLRSFENIVAIVSAMVLLIAFFIDKTKQAYIVLNLMMLSLFGCFFSGMLITQQMKIHSSLAERVCHTFKKSSCNNVLESNAAKFLGRYSWAEIGFSYFCVNLVAIMISERTQTMLAYVAALSLFYSLWSVWYQHRLSQWCPICLMVQCVLVVQFFCYFSGGFYFQPVKLDAQVVGCMISAYLCVTLTTHKFLSLLSNSFHLQQTGWKYNHLRMNEKIFNLLLHEEVKYAPVESSIEFGNKDSKVVITVFSNPYCNPCAAMHKRLQDIYATRSCLIQYVFTSFAPKWNVINKYLIAVYQQYGAEKAWEIYTRWYDKGKYSQEHFFDEFHLDMDFVKIEREFQRHERWQKSTKLNATPTILVNGHKIPYEYSVEDMQYVV